jgi:hypothetical protein
MIEPTNIIVSCLKNEQGQVYLPVRKVDGQVEYLKVLVEGSNIQLLSDTLKSSIKEDKLPLESKQGRSHSKITRKEFEDKKIEYLFRMGYVGKHLVAGVLHHGSVKTINVEISPSASLNSTLLSYIDTTNPDNLITYSNLDHVLAEYTFSTPPYSTYERFKSVETNMSLAELAEVNMPAIEAKLNQEGIYVIDPLNILI